MDKEIPFLSPYLKGGVSQRVVMLHRMAAVLRLVSVDTLGRVAGQNARPSTGAWHKLMLQSCPPCKQPPLSLSKTFKVALNHLDSQGLDQ